MKRTVFVVFPLVALIQGSFGQTKPFPENKYKDSFNPFKITGFSIGGGYSSSHFLNEVYGANFESSKIKSGFGYAANTRFIYKSVFAEVSYFISKFQADGVKQDLSLPDEYTLSHRGVEATANIILIPSSSNITFIKPFIGLGYQAGEAAIITKESFVIGKDIYSSEKTNGAIGQLGLLIFPSKQVYLSAAYKRSLNSFQENKGHTRLEVGFAYLFGGDGIRFN